MKEIKIAFSVFLFIVCFVCLSACNKNSDKGSESLSSDFSVSDNNEVSDYSGISSINNTSSQNVESIEDSISDEKLKDTEITVDFATGNVVSSSVNNEKTQSSSIYNSTSSVNVSSNTASVDSDDSEASDKDVNTSSQTVSVDPDKETMSDWTPWQ